MLLVGSDVVIKGIHYVTEGSLKKQYIPMRQKGRYSDCFVYIFSGSVQYDFSAYNFTVHPGDILYLARGSRYAMNVIMDYRFIYVDFDFEEQNALFDSAVFSIQAYEKVERIFRRMERKWIEGDFLCWIKCFINLYEIYAAVLEQKSWFYVPSDKKQEMEMIEAYIAEHFSNQKLNVIELSQKAKMSEVHFRRLFKRIYHVSPLQFITRMRIRRAKELLLDDDSTITQIAERTGYSTVFYFSRIFKKETGMTPTEYRKKVP